MVFTRKCFFGRKIKVYLKNNYIGMNYDVIAEDLLNKSKLKVFKSLMILILLLSKTNFVQIIFCLIDEDMTKNYCSRCHRL